MKKLLIATRANSNIKEMTDITHPVLKMYAEKCNADFKVIDKDIEGLHHHWRILNFYNLFDTYDRILSLDSDVLVLKKCPDLFKLVPDNMIGSIFEDVGSRKDHRRKTINDIQKERGNVGWESGYINTGVALFSKEHKEVFNADRNNLWEEPGFDDVELRYRSIQLGFKVYELPYQFNHMVMFTEKWNGMANRANSNIIHYAGQGKFSRHKNRTEQIKYDHLILKRYNLI